MSTIIHVAKLHIILAVTNKVIAIYHKRIQQCLDPVKGPKLLRRYGSNYINALTEAVTPIILIRDEAKRQLEQIKQITERNTNLEY